MKARPLRKSCALLAAILFAIAAGPGPTAAEERPAGRPPMTPARECAWGETWLREFLTTKPQSEDGNLSVRVGNIGRELAAVSDRPELIYQFVVVSEPVLQAYSFPCVGVSVSDSLSRASSDDQLAFAIGHELAHVVQRHHVAQLRVDDMREGMVGAERDVLTRLQWQWGREDEAEADRYGALYAVRAGYAFTASVESIRMLSEASAVQADASHPDFEERIENLERFRPELERSVRAFDEGTAFLRAGKADQAVQALSLFVAQFPNSLAGRINLGAAYLARARQKAGTPEGLAETLPILPAPGVTIRGVAEERDARLAQSHFEKALELGELGVEVPLARAGIALAALRQNDLATAREQLARGLQEYPGNADLELCFGNVEFLDGRMEEAKRHYDLALALKPQWPEAILNIALVHERLGETSLAREAWTSLLADARYGERARLALTRIDSGAP